MKQNLFSDDNADQRVSERLKNLWKEKEPQKPRPISCPTLTVSDTYLTYPNAKRVNPYGNVYIKFRMTTRNITKVKLPNIWNMSKDEYIAIDSKRKIKEITDNKRYNKITGTSKTHEFN